MYNPQELLNTLKEVPAMPNVIKHALDIMKDPDSSMKELAKIVSYDQSLSTKVLTLVNSAYYGFSQQITSIQRGIPLLGLAKTKNVIITVAMKPMLVSHGDKELWKHSIMAAVGCEYIAKNFKLLDPDEAFVIGFLHDLGKMILNMKDPRAYEKVREMAMTNSNITEIERTFFGSDHCTMGSLLAKQWQLPLLVNNAIKYHHNPSLSSMPVPCSLVYFVDKLVQENFDETTIDKSIVKNLNINIDQPQILSESIKSKAQMLLNELSN